MKCTHNSLTCSFDKEAALVQGFPAAASLTLGLDDSLLRGWAVHCEMFSGIPRLHPLDTSN